MEYFAKGSLTEKPYRKNNRRYCGEIFNLLYARGRREEGLKTKHERGQVDGDEWMDD